LVRTNQMVQIFTQVLCFASWSSKRRAAPASFSAKG
jgi:hypothetical protein